MISTSISFFSLKIFPNSDKEDIHSPRSSRELKFPNIIEFKIENPDFCLLYAYYHHEELSILPRYLDLIFTPHTLTYSICRGEEWRNNVKIYRKKRGEFTLWVRI